MAETVLSFVLDQLSSFLREEGRLLGGLRQEVQLISDELGHMRAFLRVAESKEEDADPRLEEWITQVREAAYDTEDVLDEFVTRFARHPATGFYGSIRRIFNSIKTLRARCKVSEQIQSIKARVKNISDGHQRYQSEFGVTAQASGSVAAVSSARWRYSRDDALLVEDGDLVGIDQPKQQLISQLLEGDDSQLKVVSVVGMGGLGKTTLAKKVLEDLDVRRHFSVRAFVTVSQTCNFQELLKDLIRQLHNDLKKPVLQLTEPMTTIQLKQIAKEFLQQAGRYAIVFDDVWEVEFWSTIRFALPENGYGNRVMLTTRKTDVASTSCVKSQDYVYKMVKLSFEDSWTLFCKKTFKGKDCPAHLVDVAKGILSKCEGLPLAILAISGLLAPKDLNIIEDWEMVRCNLGGELEGFGTLDSVRKILSLSYNDLPCHLKTCLLYLSIYPENYEIGCHRLVQLWIAERFVEKREGMTVEDVGYSYLRELDNRSLIQVTTSYFEGFAERCRIHDLVREAILSKSRKQNMATIITGQHIRWPSVKVRRLVVHSKSTLHQQECQYFCFDQLRSFITIESMSPLVSRTLLFEVLKRSKLLKVLDLRGEETLEESPNEIFNLYHLKYLNLYGTGIKAVPKSIGKLQNLEYLNLGETRVRELPMEILKLQKLQHLRVYKAVDPSDHTYGESGFTAPKLGGLFALETLYTIDASSGSIVVEELGELTQLRELGISNLRREDGKKLCSSLATLTSLRRLDIASFRKDDDDDYEAMDLNHHHHNHQQHSPPPSMSSSFLQSLRMLVLCGRLEKMPQWIPHLQSLVRINLFWSSLTDEEDPLESLHHLPNLVTIQLCGSHQGQRLCFKAGGFQRLKILHLRKLENLRSMKVEDGALPNLRELNLDGLPLLEELPLDFLHLCDLRKLALYELSPQLMEKLKNLNEDSEDYGKIAHIPEVVIGFLTNEGWKYHRLWGKKM